MIGRPIKTATKTGTTPEVNQKRAGRIRAITGVDLTRSRGKSRKAEKAFESAAKRPRKKPSVREIKKEMITRKKVKAKAFQKSPVRTSWESLNKTV